MNNNILYNNDSLNLNDFLKKYYKKLWNSIEKEEYVLDYQNFDEFFEIIHKNETVGFIALEKSDIFDSKVIVDCYVMPEARGNKLLCTSLLDLISSTRYNILSKKPTRSFILALLSYGFAFKFSENLVVSWFDFVVNLSESYKNSKIKRLYKKVTSDSENILYKADLFDLNIDCLLFIDNLEFISKDNDTLVISEPRKYDLKKYNSRKKLKKVTANYLEDINYKRIDYFDDVIEYFKDFDESLIQYFDVNGIMGSEDKLKEDVVELLNQNHLSLEDGFKIRQDIVDAIDSGEIISPYIKYRLRFLATHAEYIGKKIDVDDGDISGCPFCDDFMKGAFYTCDDCGHQFKYIKTPEEIMENTLGHDLSSLKDDGHEFDPDMFSSKNIDFLTQFDDINTKFMDFLGDDYDLFLECLENNDFLKAKKIVKSLDFSDVDWYFDRETKLDNGFLKYVTNKNYDVYEVYEAQSRICAYECVKDINENITSWKNRSIHEMNHVLFDEIEYVINQGYIKKIKNEEFSDYLKKYSVEELKEELKYFNIECSDDKKEIIKTFLEEGDFSYIVTDKGLKYLKDNPVLDFFAEYLSEFIFYEFEKYYDINKEKMSIEEIAQKYTNNEFKKSFKTGNLDVYLKYLEYYFKINFNQKHYDKALHYLIQRIIYEINKWYLAEKHSNFELAISLKTASFINQINNLNIEFDLGKIYNTSFKEFKYGHMKNNKDKIYNYIESLFNGGYFMDINDDLLEEYFN